jgi:D-alanyl-D-alanine dipeptidase
MIAMARWWAVVLGAVVIAGAAGSARAADARKLPEGIVDLVDVAPDVALDIRYAGNDNFLGRPARGYRAARCLLTKRAARALADAQRDVAAFGLGLMVYDCYRPQRAVDDFVSWSREASTSPTDPRHHPVVPKRELFPRGYIATQSGHCRGSTVDLTLIPAGPRRRAPGAVRDCRSIEGPLAPDGSLNMGTTFDCFDERSHPADDKTPAEARRNRLLLRAVMEKHGFVPYAQEWWHFTLGGEPFPKAAFDFEIQPAP